VRQRRISIGSLLAVVLCVAVVLAAALYAVDRDAFFGVATRARSYLW